MESLSQELDDYKVQMQYSLENANATPREGFPAETGRVLVAQQDLGRNTDYSSTDPCAGKMDWKCEQG